MWHVTNHFPTKLALTLFLPIKLLFNTFVMLVSATVMWFICFVVSEVSGKMVGGWIT